MSLLDHFKRLKEHVIDFSLLPSVCSQLRELCDEFAGSDSGKLRKLQKLESKIEECMKNTRLTVCTILTWKNNKLI